MIRGKEAFYQLVNEGREGHNVGLPIGSPKLEMYMDGYLPGTSYLIGGGSGSGNKNIFNFLGHTKILVYHGIIRNTRFQI